MRRALPKFGSPTISTMCASVIMPATETSARDHCGSVRSSRAAMKAALAYGRAMVAASAIRELQIELVEQLRVGLRIDLALQQARGALHGERCHLLAQALARTGRVERDLLVRLRH